MTVIKNIKLHGFKSFAKHTEIPFGEDFSVILGPNGSGKSNVMDAFCFVLGKLSAKSMRAQKSSNLIFNGGKKGKPAKHAQVDITFTNHNKEFALDTKEIKISRIVQQSGNSTYRINDEKRTREQVIDLLNSAKINPEGHNIVLQGDIIRFMEMKPVERREVIEDIAGISIYEEKKSKAMSELEKVQGKLTEAEIILTEREANLRELKKDRDQAKRFQELKDKIKDNKATYINFQIKEKETKKEDLQKKYNEAKSKIEKLEVQINTYKQEINKKREEIKNINVEIEEKGEKQQLVLRKEIEDLKTGLITHKTRVDTLTNEIEKIETRKKQLNNSIIETNNNIKELNTKKKEFDTQIKSLKLEESKLVTNIDKIKERLGIKGIDNISQKISDLDSEIEQKTNSLFKLKEDIQDLIREKDKLTFQIENIDEKINKVDLATKQDKEKGSNLKNLRQDFKKVTLDLNKDINQDSAYSNQLRNARSKLIEMNNELAKLKAQSLGRKEYLSGDISVKKILSLKKKGVIGTIRDLATVNNKFSLALEVAAGPRLRSIVVDNDSTAASCIQHLKDNKLGIATFLPLNKIKPRILPKNLPSKNQSVHGLAVELIKFDPKYKDVFSYALGSTLIVENIETARRIGIGRIRMVTLDGTLLEPSGAMIGGHRSNSRSYGFNEKESMLKIKELEKENLRLTNIISLVEQKKLQLEEQITKSREIKTNLEIEITKLENTLGIKEDTTELKQQKLKLATELKDIETDIKTHNLKINGLNKEIENTKKSKNSLQAKAQKVGVSSNLTNLEEDKLKLHEKILGISTEIKHLDNQINMFNIEIGRTTKIIADSEKEREAFKTELTDLKEIIKNKSLDFKTKEKEETSFYGKFKNLAITRNKFQEEIQKRENKISAIDEGIKNIASRLNNISIDKAKVTAETEALQREFEEFKDGKIRRGISLENLKLEIREFERKVSTLGSVNLRALEIYEGLQEEHTKLLEKVDKIKLEKEDVLGMMSEIDEKKKDLFLKTYKEIAKNFTRIFSNLSTKGDAFFELENKEDPLSAGIDIKVRIIGNKFLDIKSLSGGEKTLTALAFIFAIQEHSPASFYLLDEVDAALDKHNSEKLSKLINQYSSNAQYIVISHNDSVITEASKIYGVSMQNNVSNIVSLKI